MIILAAVTAVLLLLSFIFNAAKTISALRISLRMFLNLLPQMIPVLFFIAFILALLPPETIEKYMGQDSGITGFLVAGAAGSIALIPGFVAYPMAGVLVKNGVSYPVISVFITTLMMVGILTLPIERKFFGWKVSITRNILSFAAAIAIGTAMAILWRFL